MNTATYDALEVEARTFPRAALTTVWRTFCALWKFGAAILLAMSPFASVLVVGWTSRFMQRSACKAWWKQGRRPYKKLLSFRSVAEKTPGWTHLASWPNWLISHDITHDLRRWRLHRLLASFWLNVKLGVQMAFNTTVVLALPCLLWTFAWYAGWQVSFNKAYEYFENGALLGLTASVLFVVAMFYLPMAQARQAVTGEWRRFYDFRFVRRVIRRRWFVCALLALLYAAGGFIAMILISIVPMSKELQAWVTSLPGEKVQGAIRGYYLAAAAVLVPIYIGLRWVAARIYASAVLLMLKGKQIGASDLSAAERLALGSEIDRDTSAVEWTRWKRVLAWSRSAPGRVILGILVFAAWGAFVFEIFISQFFVMRGARVWCNHPLVQLPWMDYTPKKPAEPL